MKEDKTTINYDCERVRKLIKNAYPGCRTYVKGYTHTIEVRVIHHSFEKRDVMDNISEVMELLKNINRLLIIEPITEEIWANRKW